MVQCRWWFYWEKSIMVVHLVVASGNRAGQVIPVTVEKFIIGRAADCHLKPTSELISRYHCALLVGNDVVVRDLGSRNGVRLNDERISTEQKLNNGDKLAVGPLEFRVCISTDGNEPMGSLSADNEEHEIGPSAPTVIFKAPDSNT